MKKNEFKAIYKNANLTGERYIGIKVETEGSRKPEVVIIQNEDFDAKFENYMMAYNDDMVMELAGSNENVPISRITDIATGETFKDIEYHLFSVGYGWKKLISDAIDKTYNKMIAETHPESEEEKIKCETMKEAVKGMFLAKSRTEAEERFIVDNIGKYEEIFDICMNGDDIGFRKGLVELQRMQNECMLRED